MATVLQRYVGEVVIVLPDLQDPVEEENQITSDADVRYMGFLAAADDSVIELHPYFELSRKPDTEREAEIARTLDPSLAEQETGIRARMTIGSAAVGAGAKARTGSMIRSPLIIPISQCDAIHVYRERDPETAR